MVTRYIPELKRVLCGASMTIVSARMLRRMRQPLKGSRAREPAGSQPLERKGGRRIRQLVEGAGGDVGAMEWVESR